MNCNEGRVLWQQKVLRIVVVEMLGPYQNIFSSSSCLRGHYEEGTERMEDLEDREKGYGNVEFWA